MGYLDTFTITFFFREIVRRLRRTTAMGTVVTGDVSTSLDHDKICADDVSDEIFDMAKPLDPLRITLADLLRCGAYLLG